MATAQNLLARLERDLEAARKAREDMVKAGGVDLSALRTLHNKITMIKKDIETLDCKEVQKTKSTLRERDSKIRAQLAQCDAQDDLALATLESTFSHAEKSLSSQDPLDDDAFEAALDHLDSIKAEMEAIRLARESRHEEHGLYLAKLKTLTARLHSASSAYDSMAKTKVELVEAGDSRDFKTAARLQQRLSDQLSSRTGFERSLFAEVESLMSNPPLPSRHTPLTAPPPPQHQSPQPPNPTEERPTNPVHSDEPVPTPQPPPQRLQPNPARSGTTPGSSPATDQAPSPSHRQPLHSLSSLPTPPPALQGPTSARLVFAPPTSPGLKDIPPWIISRALPTNHQRAMGQDAISSLLSTPLVECDTSDSQITTFRLYKQALVVPAQGQSQSYDPRELSTPRTSETRFGNGSFNFCCPHLDAAVTDPRSSSCKPSPDEAAPNLNTAATDSKAPSSKPNPELTAPDPVATAPDLESPNCGPNPSEATPTLDTAGVDPRAPNSKPNPELTTPNLGAAIDPKISSHKPNPDEAAPSTAATDPKAPNNKPNPGPAAPNLGAAATEAKSPSRKPNPNEATSNLDTTTAGPKDPTSKPTPEPTAPNPDTEAPDPVSPVNTPDPKLMTSNPVTAAADAEYPNPKPNSTPTAPNPGAALPDPECPRDELNPTQSEK